jgi:hypothetical protein
LSKTHVVRQGDHISAIAADAGFGDFHLIWDHPENAALAQVRDPHALLPGDRIFIPDREDRQESRATDAAHRFVADVPKLFLRVKLLDVDGQPLKGVSCELTLPPADEAVAKSADGAAIVEERIARLASMRGRLLAHPPHKPPLAGERDARYDLHVGDLDPHTELSGQQARLSNLGYFAGYGALDLDALLWAAEEFRCDQGTKRAKTRPQIKPAPPPPEGEPPPRDPAQTSGIDDAALVKKLRDAHGV